MNTQIINGFLLTRQWRDIDTGSGTFLQLSYWISTEQGAIQLVFEQQQAVFFLPQNSFYDLLTRLDNAGLTPARWQNIALKDFHHQPVVACYYNSQREVYQARNLLTELNSAPLEADIRHQDRFLMERFITAGMTLRGVLKQRNGYHKVVNPELKRADYTPRLNILCLDIETAMYRDEIFCIGIIFYPHSSTHTPLRQVFMRGDETAIDSPEIHYVTSESELIMALLDAVQTLDPDIIIGWNVINFDLRFLQRCCENLSIRFTIGRNRSLPQWRESNTSTEHYTLTLPGRVVLDGIDTLKSATYHFESFALNAVAEKLLGRGKIIQSCQRGEAIATLFAQDKPALAEYNLEDCQLVWEIFQHTKLFDFAIERARLTGLAMDRTGGSVAAFDFRYLPRLHRSGFIAPNVKQQPEDVGSPGGYVMDSFPGIYDDVLVLDFKSLYPSIIRTFNIDPLALINSQQIQASTAVRDRLETVNNHKNALVAGFNGALFDKDSALLPSIIAELWAARDQAKQQGNASMSQAIKIIMNSFYGVLGTPGCRFFDYRLPSSITLRGHDVLNQTKALIEQQGHRVIYGDTDSVFVHIEKYGDSVDKTQIKSLGQQLTGTLNHWWRDHLQQHYQLESFLELEFESHFSRFVMPTIRGSDVGSKKRYAGLLNTPGGQELVFKGLETIRTDWTRAARDFQHELYRRIFYQLPYREFIIATVADIQHGRCDNQLVYRKRLRRKLDEYQKNIPPHVQAARIAEQQRLKDKLPQKYRQGSWVEYVITLNGAEPVEYQRSTLDYDFYIERQIEPITDGILHFFGESFSQICGKQIDLFD